MSTATKQRRQFETRKVPNLVSMSPAPCRMIGVEVFKDDDGTHGVCWSHVIGFLCVVETIYSKPSESGKYSTGGANHAEMEELGWYTDDVPNYEVYPVIIERDCGPVRIWNKDALDDCDNRVARSLEVCHWPPEKDRENAIRIGKELLESPYGTLNNANHIEKPES